MPVEATLLGLRRPAAVDRIEVEDAWTARDALVYELATTGVLRRPSGCDPQVLPTFATRAVECIAPALRRRAAPAQGRTRLLWHQLILPQPVAPAGPVYHSASLTTAPALAGPGAVAARIRTRSATGRLLSVNEASIGRDPGAERAGRVPGRPPDVTVALPASSLRSALYRLTVPLAQFDDLALYGSLVQTAVDNFLEGDSAAVRTCRARFVSSPRPWEPVVARLWRAGEDVVGEAYACERDAPLITDLRVSTRLED